MGVQDPTMVMNRGRDDADRQDFIMPSAAIEEFSRRVDELVKRLEQALRCNQLDRAFAMN
jgi:hypothetical protein